MEETEDFEDFERRRKNEEAAKLLEEKKFERVDEGSDEEEQDEYGIEEDGEYESDPGMRGRSFDYEGEAISKKK